MPAKLMRLKQTGGVVLSHQCEVKNCENNACYGFDVGYRKALKNLESLPNERKHKANNLLGRWYCKGHKHLAENGLI